MLYGYYGYWDLWKEYHKVTFDGLNKLILINDGVDFITVKEIYSSWKEWFMLYENSRWEPAMRSVGGDQISESVFLGATFFLINGWRIKPFDRDHRLVVDGNIYTDPSGDSPFLTTSGDYKVLIESTNSALVYSTLAQQEEIEHTVFSDGVTIDITLVGSANQGTAYPLGTPFKPVNNLPDALSIARTRGFTNLYVRGNLTINSGEDISTMHVYGQGATLNVTKTLITFVQGCITTNAHYHDCRVTGYQGGESNYHNCIIAGIENAHCHYDNCGFVLPTTPTYTIKHSASVGSTHITDLHGCYSDELTPVVDRNGTGMNQIYTSYSGRIKFINQNKASGSGNIWIHMNGGTVTIDASCTKGSFFISGTCTVVNQSGGSVVDVSQVSTPAIVAAAVRTELDAELDHVMALQNGQGLDSTQATMLLEIYRLYGLDPSKPLVVTQTGRTAGAEIQQQINTNASQTVVTRV